MKVESNDMNEMTRILSGEASAKERDHFYETLETDPRKKQVFEMVEKEWVTAGDAMLYKSLDVDAAWQRHHHEYLDMENKDKRSTLGVVLKWAAIIIVTAGVAFYFVSGWMGTQQQFTSLSTGERETLPLDMTDGSKVTLNQNSSVAYKFNGEIRQVNFTGEAYFEVAADPDRPFVIEMENAYVKVVGTAFNIKTDGSAIDVIVNDGLVEFGLKDRSEKAWIEAGSMGKLYEKHLSKVDIEDPNAISWYTRELVFDQSPLPTVFRDVSNTYHVDFKYDNNLLKNCRLTADFSNEELPNVLETLRTIFKVDFKKDENVYVVTGEACDVE